MSASATYADSHQMLEPLSKSSEALARSTATARSPLSTDEAFYHPSFLLLLAFQRRLRLSRAAKIPSSGHYLVGRKVLLATGPAYEDTAHCTRWREIVPFVGGYLKCSLAIKRGFLLLKSTYTSPVHMW